MLQEAEKESRGKQKRLEKKKILQLMLKKNLSGLVNPSVTRESDNFPLVHIFVLIGFSRVHKTKQKPGYFLFGRFQQRLCFGSMHCTFSMDSNDLIKQNILW